LSFAEVYEGENDGDDEREEAPARDEAATTTGIPGCTSRPIA